MKILDSNIIFNSNHHLYQYSESKEHLSVWDKNHSVTINNSDKEINDSNKNINNVNLNILKKSNIVKDVGHYKNSTNKNKVDILNEEHEMMLPPKLQLMKTILEKIFGIKINIIKPGQENPIEKQEKTRQSESKNAGWGVEYSYSEIKYKKEEVNFSSSGIIKTVDQKEINFNISFLLSKETIKRKEINFKAGDALLDPLIINYDGKGSSLTEKKIEFDIDSDGKKDRISFLSEGSGFLSLDKNNNGIIDDGSELFGPKTNDGFFELKEYDKDNNNWIDENDLIYYDLSLWTKDNSGNDHLSSLSDKGIGAIYLESTETKFDLKEGKLRESGIYVAENGTVGLIQEVDLLVETQV